jgi:hypothetical protein
MLDELKQSQVEWFGAAFDERVVTTDDVMVFQGVPK